MIGEGERDPPLLIVEPGQGLPVTAGQREDPDAAHTVRGAVLDLGRRQRRVPVPDGGEVPQQGPDLADRAAYHCALRYLRHVSLLAGARTWTAASVSSRPGRPRDASAASYRLCPVTARNTEAARGG